MANKCEEKMRSFLQCSLLLQVTKSFLVPLGAHNDTKKAKLLFDNFIDGIKNETTWTNEDRLNLAGLLINNLRISDTKYLFATQRFDIGTLG